jgi:hypothetical protein
LLIALWSRPALRRGVALRNVLLELRELDFYSVLARVFVLEDGGII